MLLQVNRLSNLLQELKESIADQIKKKKKKPASDPQHFPLAPNVLMQQTKEDRFQILFSYLYETETTVS